MTDNSNITAIVLTTGEATTQRAIDSINKQTVVPAAILVINDISPFHKAFDAGISNVRTEFFVQVDADMILDTGCFEALYGCMAPNVAIASAWLRDPMLGPIRGIKLFRTARAGCDSRPRCRYHRSA